MSTRFPTLDEVVEGVIGKALTDALAGTHKHDEKSVRLASEAVAAALRELEERYGISFGTASVREDAAGDVGVDFHISDAFSEVMKRSEFH